MTINTTIEGTQVSDSMLLQRFLDGDSEAFSTLVGRYQHNLYIFLVRFVGDAGLAEDVFQETFLQVYQSAPMFDMTRRFRPWLFTVAANKARDALRSRKRRSAAPLDAIVAGTQDVKKTYATIVPSEIPSPDEISMNLEMRQSVKTIIDQLPENYRIVLILSYFQEIPHKDIAEILGVPVGTVKSRLHGAVGLFAQKWKAWVPAKDVEINIISPADYGIVTHGYTVFASEQLISEKPELVQRFLRASLKGVKYTVEHPEEANKILLKRDPNLDEALCLKRQLMYNAVTSNSEEYPPGYMDKSMFQGTYDRLVEEGVIENGFDVSEAYNGEFLEKIYSRSF